MSKVISAKEAAELVKDRDTLCVGGFIGFGLAEDVLTQLEKRYLEDGHPKDLSLLYAAGLAGDGKTRGSNHFGHEGMVRRMYCGNNSQNPVMAEYIANNLFPTYMAPQGVICHLFRAIAAGEPGVVTHVGLGTYCDPRVGSCKANAKCDEDDEGVVELVNIKGKDYLFYPSLPIDICFIKGTSADEYGNISIEHEAVCIEQYEIAAATRNSGGIVVAQVDRLVQRGTIPPSSVVVPGIMVDHVVVGDPANSRQHYDPAVDQDYVAAWTGEIKIPLASLAPLPLNVRKVCGRRGIFELKRGGLTNLGVGMPASIAAVANEEGIADQVILSIESGVTGGIPAAGLSTGAAYNPEAIIKQVDIFDFYDGGGIDVAYLGLAQVDAQGNVNVSKFANRVTGPGGFIDITQNAKKVCFMGSFTAGKSQIQVGDGALTILADAPGIKFVKEVEQITFSGAYSRQEGKQEVLFITERAVFRLAKEGLELIEIAPGVDLDKDILAHMEFRPLIAEDLKLMDPRIFSQACMSITADDLG